MGKERAEAPRRIEEKDLPSIEDGSLAALARSADWRMDSDDGERVWLDLGAKEMEGALDALGRFWASGENERDLGRADVYGKGEGFSGNARLEFKARVVAAMPAMRARVAREQARLLEESAEREAGPKGARGPGRRL